MEAKKYAKAFNVEIKLTPYGSVAWYPAFSHQRLCKYLILFKFNGHASFMEHTTRQELLFSGLETPF